MSKTDTTKKEKELIERIARFFDEGKHISWHGWELAKLIRTYKVML